MRKYHGPLPVDDPGYYERAKQLASIHHHLGVNWIHIHDTLTWLIPTLKTIAGAVVVLMTLVSIITWWTYLLGRIIGGPEAESLEDVMDIGQPYKTLGYLCLSGAPFWLLVLLFTVIKYFFWI